MTLPALLEQPCNLQAPTSLLQVVNSLFQTWKKQKKHNLSTACEQTCYNLFANLLQLVHLYI